MFTGFINFLYGVYQRQQYTPFGTLFLITFACFVVGVVCLVFRFVKSLNVFN